MKVGDIETLLKLAETVSEVGYWCLDVDTHTLSWSEQTCRIHGVDASYTPNLETAINFYHPEDRSMVQRHVARAMQTGTPYFFECRLVRADGFIRVVYSRGQCIINPETSAVRMVLGTFQDVTEQKLEEAARGENERRLRSIMDTVLDCIILINSRGIIEAVNPACNRLLGYTEEELLGKNVGMLMGGEHRPHHDGYIQRYMKTGEARIIGIGREVEALRKDGSLVSVDLSISTFEMLGEPCFVGVLHDISERKQTEAEMNRLIERLTESNEELERYAYVCSHDLQEPLRMIRGFSTKLTQALHGQDLLDETLEHYLHYITSNAERAQELVRDVLAYARLEKCELPEFPVPMNDVMNDVTEALAGLISYHKAEIETATLPVLHGNRTQLYQLMLNLLSNALKFQPIGQPARIRVWSEQDTQYCTLYIQDNGIGIPKEHEEKIFHVFKRLHHRSEYPGNGIGLAVCRKIMERHGGVIRFDSEEGAGTTFYLMFPIHVKEGDHAAKPQTS